MSVSIDRETRVTDLLRERQEGEGRRRRSPVEVAIDRTWRFLCSVRAALYEIGFLTLLVLIGTLKGSTIPAQIPKYVPALEPLVERWYAFDVFHSLIFSATLALIAVAIVVCTANRVPGIWSAIVSPTVRTPVSFFDRADIAAWLSPTDEPGRVEEQMRDLLRRRRYRVLTERHGEEIHLYADKNRFARLGTFPFHLALILVLVGGIVGSEYGFREPSFVVPEGSVRDVGRGTGLRVELERFVDTYDEIGAPTSYRSDLVLYDGAEEVKRQSVTVNRPMTYDGATFYQASFGPAAAMRVSDQEGRPVFDDAVAFDYASRSNSTAPAGLIELPAQGMRLELVFPNVALDSMPEIGDVKLAPGQMFVQAREWSTNAVIGQGVVINQGETATFAGYGVEFLRERRFTVLQIGYNPGIPILFAASLLLVLGLVITFALPHRRIRFLLRPSSDGASRLLLAPMARRDWSGKRDFVRTLALFEATFGVASPYGRLTHVVD